MPDSTPCRKCAAPMEPDARFCGACGTHVLACASCGQALEPDDRVCPQCGTAVPVNEPVAAPAISPAQRSAWDRVLEQLVEATAGEFEIEGELGRGGMAAVYLARETGLNRMVAIKVMSPTLLMDDSMVQRFRQEAVTLANLHHPNIVPIYAVREDDDLNFFVMKFVAGRALDHILAGGRQLPIPVVRALLFQVGGALATAHRRGIVHRDIKPANILVDTEGNAIVTDFGIAKVAEAPGQTQTGTAIGTPAYMSPEQCRGDSITAASDQYSLGVVAYEMLTGQPPFTGPTLDVMQAHAGSPPPSIVARRPDCPPELEAALLRMLAKDPAERWPTVTQAVTAADGVQLEADDPVRAELIAMATAGSDPLLRARDIAVPAALSGPRSGGKTRRKRASEGVTVAPRSRRWWLAVPALLIVGGVIFAATRTPAPVVPPPPAPLVPPPPAARLDSSRTDTGTRGASSTTARGKPPKTTTAAPTPVPPAAPGTVVAQTKAATPPPPPAPQAPAVPTADDLHRAVDACAKALSSGKEEEVTRLFRPHNKQDADNLGKFLEIVTRGEAQLTTDAVGDPVAGPLADNGVAVKFSLRVQYRKPAGGKFDNTRPFIAQLERGTSRWTVTECRADGKLSIN